MSASMPAPMLGQDRYPVRPVRLVIPSVPAGVHDGYSILLGSTTTHVPVTPLMANPPYDPVKDFSAVCVFAYSSTSIVINPSLPVRQLAELITYAKANPGKLSYGSAGRGSITHVAGEYFKQLAGGLDILVVPYKGPEIRSVMWRI